MKQLIYEINKVKYLLFEAELISKTHAEDFTKRIKSHKGIVQSYVIKESFWQSKKVNISVLIPEFLADSFSNF